MSEPAWAQPGRQYVPSHVQPGSTRSSFAKPDSYNLPQHSSPQPVSAGHSLAPASQSPSRLRSGFASRHKSSRAKRHGSADVVSEDESPPTLSIRSAAGQSLDLEGDSSFGLNSVNSPATAASELKSRRSRPSEVSVMVFGFPPGSTPEVSQFFGKLGEIVENSQSSASPASDAADRSNIECGRNWSRITFRDRQSALTALSYNGHIMPGQYVIGCVLADPSDATPGHAQSSTNSSSLDDSELSFVQEQSSGSLDSGTNNGLPSHGEKATEKTADESASSVGKIVPVELSGATLFKEPPPSRSILSESSPKATEFTTTPAPNAKPQNQSLAKRASTKVTDSVFGWDV